MLLKLICCNVFMREACLAIADSPHIIDVEFTELGEHIHSETLRGLLQKKIDDAAASVKKYDAILLLFGICGNATTGLRAPATIPLVIPRAHDCCTILLGSRARFAEHFKDNPSKPFSSCGYMERGNYYLRTGDGDTPGLHYGDGFAALVEQYGEENARYVWEQMHPPSLDGTHNEAVFISHPETTHLGHAERFKAKASAEGKRFVEIEGSLSLIRNLIHGNWNTGDFLTVSPGRTIAGVYDWDKVIQEGQ